jgi:pimeloyl-ACP methyl ester carboxylesterase
MTISISAPTAFSAPIAFQAHWFENNRHLAETLIEKITRTALFCINKLIICLVLPATQISQERVKTISDAFEKKWHSQDETYRFLNKNFAPVPIEITTPDGVKLRGTFFKNVTALKTGPTVIFFQPNAMLSKQGAFDWVLTEAALQEFPYHFVYFDYRGCGESEGTPYSKKNLFLDGESLYQFVRDNLHVSPNDIHFYGWSLGGGISSNVKKIHSDNESRYVNERSFNSIENVIKNVLDLFIGHWINFISNSVKSTLYTGIIWFADFWLSLLNWKIQSTKAIENLKGKTLIVHHSEDELMKNEASLYHSLFQRTKALPNLEELNLNHSTSHPSFIHGARLEAFADVEAEHKIAQFLFSSNASFSERILNRFASASPQFRDQVFSCIAKDFQNGGSYRGSGEDAFYNRNGLSVTDAIRTYAIVKTKLFAT